MDNLREGILSYQVAGIQAQGGKYDTVRKDGHLTLKTIRKPSYTKAMRRHVIRSEAIDYYSSFKSRPKHFFSKGAWSRMSKENRLLWHMRAMARDNHMIGDISFEIV